MTLRPTDYYRIPKFIVKIMVNENSWSKKIKITKIIKE